MSSRHVSASISAQTVDLCELTCAHHLLYLQVGVIMCKQQILSSLWTALPVSAKLTSNRWRTLWRESSSHLPALSERQEYVLAPYSTVTPQGDWLNSYLPSLVLLYVQIYTFLLVSLSSELNSHLVLMWMALSWSTLCRTWTTREEIRALALVSNMLQIIYSTLHPDEMCQRSVESLFHRTWNYIFNKHLA